MSGASYATVLWDLDGTIADTLPLIRDSLRHAVTEVLGHAPDEERLTRNIFLPLEDQMRVFDPDRVDVLCAAYLAWNHAVSRDRLHPHPGMPALVRELHARGVRQGIASSKSRAGVALALELLDLEPYFGAVVTPDECPAHKPDPAPLQMAMQQLAHTDGPVCYVGDALTDMAAARAAGITAIGVAWGFYDAEALRGAQADVVCERPEELRAVLLGDAA